MAYGEYYDEDEERYEEEGYEEPMRRRLCPLCGSRAVYVAVVPVSGELQWRCAGCDSVNIDLKADIEKN